MCRALIGSLRLLARFACWGALLIGLLGALIIRFCWQIYINFADRQEVTRFDEDNAANGANLAETAFLVSRNLGEYDLRWFTPGDEVDLCGHATLASAHTLYQHYGYEGKQIVFHTRSGELIVSLVDEGRYLMDFPADHGKEVADWSLIEKAVGTDILECYKGKDDYMAVVRDQETLEALQPDYRAIMALDARGLLITTEGSDHDFVSRCFFPVVAVDEDPVTGSAGDRVALLGSAITYMKAEINTGLHSHHPE